MLLNPIFFVLDQIARVVSMVDQHLGESRDAESEELAKLAREVEAVMPTIDRGKARLNQMRMQLPVGVAFVDHYRDELLPLASGIRLVATNQWISSAEAETWNSELDDLLLPLLGIQLVWGLAATERALEHEGIDAAGLQPLLWEPLMHEVREYLKEQRVAAATEQVLASAERTRALYQTALEAPSIDTDEKATNLVRQVSALLTNEVRLQADMAAVLAQNWRMLNFCMFPMIYRVLGEDVEKAHKASTMVT